MFDQLTDLVKQFGGDAVVNNAAVPNEYNDAVMNEASSSILDGLKNMVASGNVSDIAGLFQGNNAADSSNPVVQKLTEQLTGSLGEKFGLSSEASSGVA
jgi:thiazole synthase ThiGH ThiG subunit